MNKYKAGDTCEITLSEEMAKQLNIINKLGFTPDNCQLAAFTFESKEYDILTKLLGNRTVSEKNIAYKTELLEKNGFKSTNPVIINIKGEIIDGQHRRMAAEDLGISYKFIVDVNSLPKDSLQTTIELNNSGKPWITEDYVKAYAENGYNDYQKLLELKDELDLNLSKTFILYLGAKANADLQRTISKGKFCFDEDKANDARERKAELDMLTELVNTRYKTLVSSQPFYSAYLELTRKDNFKYKTLKNQFEKMRYTVLDRKNISETLIDVYNMQRKTNKITY